ncbi:outer membrane protein assembly factor BamA [bacterium]|nr:outer membrane protein assembly factor BamA [bacterium]
MASPLNPKLKIILALLWLIISINLADSLEGYRSVVQSVNFRGNKQISNQTLSLLMETKSLKFYHRLTKKPFLNEEMLRNDISQIREYYITRGFLKVEIKYTLQYTGDKDEFVHIVIFIEEGKQYIFRALETDGMGFITTREILDSLHLTPDMPFNGRLKREYREKINQLLANYGYPYAEVTLGIDTTGVNGIILNLSAKPNKLAFLGKVYFKGNLITRNFVMKRAICFKKGDTYSLSAVRKTRDDLYKTGLFSYVKMEPRNFEEEPDTLDFDILVVEKKPQWVGLATSAGTDETYDMTSDVTIEWGHRNLAGTSRSLTFKEISQFHLITEWENLSNRLELSFTEPWVFGLNIPTSLRLYFEPGNRLLTQYYRIQNLGGKVTSYYEPSRETMHSVSFSYERVDIYGITDSDIEDQIKDEEGILIERKLGYIYHRDKRDNIFTPTKGYSINISLDYAGGILGGDDNYASIQATLSKYITIWNKIIFAQRIRGAVIGNLMADEDILPHHKYFLGGANTIRGFRERHLGPLNSAGEPLGGKVLFLTNLEFRFPILWRFWGNAFLDIGNLWAQPTDVNPQDLIITTGWGLQFLTPVGPIRFEYGYKTRRDIPPPYSNWHLAILYAF